MVKVTFKSASIIAIPTTGVTEPTDDRIKPFIPCVFQTEFGNVACIAAPIKGRDLFKDKAKTVHAIMEATIYAAECGARTISYTGTLPASTRGLLDIQEAIERSGLLTTFPTLRITTGHETVAAAFALNMERICSVTNRHIDNEHVTFVGLGHIGNATIELIFRLGYRPRNIYLVDITAKEARLNLLRERLIQHYGYRGNIRVVTVEKTDSMPNDLYDKTTFIFGATSSPEIVDIDKLKPGTLMVDDSFPLCYDTKKAIRRLETRKDILITIAGALSSRHKITCLERNYSEYAWINEGFSNAEEAISVDSGSLTGCVYSSVLSGHFGLPTTLGRVNPDDVFEHYQCYNNNKFSGTNIYIFDTGESGKYFISDDIIQYFIDHYSATPTISTPETTSVGLFKGNRTTKEGTAANGEDEKLSSAHVFIQSKL